MTNEHALLTVVRAALWGEDLKGGLMPTDCFQHLMHEAKRQTVVGLFVQALSEERYQIRLAKSDAINAFVYQNKIRSLNLKVNAVLAELCCLLRAHSIDFIVVKGQLLAQFYPQPLMRQAGDIDFYCDETNFEKARKLIGEAWNVTFHDDDEDDREQHIGFEYKGILFELHFCLLSFISPRVQRCFDEMVSHSAPYMIKVGDVLVPTLSPVENVIFTFLHLYHHFIELGVGLRQICDMALMLHQYRDVLNSDEGKAQLTYWLKQLGFYRAFHAFGAVCVDVLGLPVSEYPFELTKRARSYEHAILEVVFKRGNFGMHGRKNSVRSGIGYYVEAFLVKLRHYLKFFVLSRRENLAMLFYGIVFSCKNVVEVLVRIAL